MACSLHTVPWMPVPGNTVEHETKAGREGYPATVGKVKTGYIPDRIDREHS